MVHPNAFNSYQKAQVYDEMNPFRLIHMLYEGAIKRVILSRQGIENNDAKQRGENLGKAIAIISELNACLDPENQTEEIQFLRSLYAAMLTELPKVSLTGDVETLNRAEKYLKELKRIWETTVLNNPEVMAGKNLNNAQPTPAPNAYATPGAAMTGGTRKPGSIAV